MDLQKKLKIFAKNNRILLKIFVSINFRKELALYKGNFKLKTNKQSIIHFSVHKAATQTVNKILIDCAKKNNLIPINWERLAFNSKYPSLLDLKFGNKIKSFLHIFKHEGFLYSPIYADIPSITSSGKFKIILMIRDPRDIVVSNYFSSKFSHLPPSVLSPNYNIYMERRRNLTDIDTFVLERIDGIINILSEYYDNIINNKTIKNNVLVLTYEEMVLDFQTWLRKIIEFCEFNNIDENILETKYNRKPKSENIYKHIRKGKIGDYKEKLRNDTIEMINYKYKDILTTYGYQI